MLKKRGGNTQKHFEGRQLEVHKWQHISRVLGLIPAVLCTETQNHLKCQ